MRQLLTKSFVRALIITVVSGLIIVGGIYAYETLWSGKSHIIIEPPEGAGQLEVTNVEARHGTWDDSSKTWTVSIPRGGHGELDVTVTNVGGDATTCYMYISNIDPAPGVTLTAFLACPHSGWSTSGYVLAAGESKTMEFVVWASADAQPGTLPEIELRMGE